jgi:hypothetical protein|uniref:Uncharacterized protein n=1 Tax=Siphoviridae sp. ctss15 TaxID=2825699 RepID=A0A8S5TRF5_9CAUD|nr:MAG TPA: hypothetical protein [Siphoviridae sp. ctss15]
MFMRFRRALTAAGKHKTGGSTIPTGQCPNLFTLCPVQAFAACNSLQVLLEPYHFHSFGSAHGLLAGKPSGVPDTVGYDYWHITVSFNLFTECSAVSVATFSQFNALWHRCCDPTGREQAKSKGWSRKPPLLKLPKEG